MGADGGVCWVRVKDRIRFLELVEPFGFLFWNDSHEENEAWFGEHVEEGCVYSTYGTDQRVSLDDLEEVLEEIESLSDNPLHGEWVSYTFEEIREDIETRPYDPWTWSPLERFFREDESRKGFPFNMNCVQWAKEVRASIDGPFYCEETWT